MSTVKTTLIEGVGWPEVGEWPHRFIHASKPIRQFPPLKKKKSGIEKGRDTDIKFEEWLAKPQPIKKRSS